MRFVLKLDRAQVEFLRQKLSVSASGIRAVKLCLCLDTSLVTLQTLDLSRCGNDITDAGLQALAPLVALQTLNLSFSKNITDTGLQTLGFLVSLQTLNLVRCKKITDAGLQALAPLVSWRYRRWTCMSALQTLDLSACKKITDTGLQALAPLVALQTLN